MKENPALRYIQSLCPCVKDDEEEKKQFVKYESSGNEYGLESKRSLSTTNGEKCDQGGEKNEVGQHEDCKRISAWQAGWNVTNMIQGMFVLSLPYAMLQGGYWSIAAIIVLGYVGCYTGKILIQCLYEENEEGEVVRVRTSYVQIAEQVFGDRFGGKIVNCTQIVELIIMCTLYLLICGQLLNGCFPGLVSLPSWIMLSTCPLLPCAFLQTLKRVSWFSLWCTVAHLSINVIIIIYCFTQLSEWKWSEMKVHLDIWTFPLALGLIVYSYAAQIIMPSVEGSMIHRERFNYMTNVSHFISALCKIVFAYVSFLTWGSQTQEVVTNNLPSQTVRIIANLFLVAKALFSYPLMYFAAVEMIEAAMFQGRSLTLFPVCLDKNSRLKIWAVALRCGLIVAITVLAIILPYLVTVASLIGNFNGALLCFIWPCWFHLKLHWNKLKWYQKTADIAIIVFGIIFGTTGVYYSIRALSLEVQGFPLKPTSQADTSFAFESGWGCQATVC